VKKIVTMPISKEILELHHAAYGVENTQDGVRFFFALPVQPKIWVIFPGKIWTLHEILIPSSLIQY